MKLAALCDKDTAVGLMLAGVKDTYVSEGNASDVWNEVTSKDDIGILFITEKIAEDLGRELKEFRLRNRIPIVIEITDKSGRKKDHMDYVSHLIKKAVGVEVSKDK